jgi:uncharacterized protein with ATP-grasp and redox domains
METLFDCIPCLLNQTLSTVRKITDDEEVHEKALREVLRIMAGANLSASPPMMAQQIYSTVREITGNKDPFTQEKTEHNRFALSLIPELREKYNNDTDLFAKMLRLSIAGNIIDYGVNNTIKRSDVLRSLEYSMKIKIDKEAVNDLRDAIRNARTILYLGDNAGEIVFDYLFIEQLPYEKITFVVRGAPVINDVTLKDARDVNMFSLVNVIDNGSDAPGTILDDCSKEFQKRFKSADLIIAKGQGNYETLSNSNKKIFFLLQAKCPAIARDIGCEVGTFIVKKMNSRKE